MITLVRATQKDRDLLWNINQKYLYEMTNFYNDPMDEEGNYHYGYFYDYFINPRRFAYFLYENDLLIGFAMICPYSNINENPDFTMAEFTIFPQYRKKGYAREVVEQIFDTHKGNWEVKYNENNIPARNLWKKVTSRYNPEIARLNKDETVLIFHVK